MTIIAAIHPPKGAPFFVADTLVSKPGNNTDINVLGPGGLVKQAKGQITSTEPLGEEVRDYQQNDFRRLRGFKLCSQTRAVQSGACARRSGAKSPHNFDSGLRIRRGSEPSQHFLAHCFYRRWQG